MVLGRVPIKVYLSRREIKILYEVQINTRQAEKVAYGPNNARSIDLQGSATQSMCGTSSTSD